MGKIHFLNVGCANCTIFETGNETILIDCAEGIWQHQRLLPADHRIKAVFITHQHFDHFKGLAFLIEKGYIIPAVNGFLERIERIICPVDHIR